MLEASETASFSVRTLDVFLYRPKPKFFEWLEIKPAQAVTVKFPVTSVHC